jgi:hypothetical protein
MLEKIKFHIKFWFAVRRTRKLSKEYALRNNFYEDR